jgi:hypothetical protein
MPKSKRKKRSKSKTGFFGVFKRTSGKYQAFICINRKTKYLGSSYDTAKQAAKAYDKEAIKLRRPFSKLNYPKKAPVGLLVIHQYNKHFYPPIPSDTEVLPNVGRIIKQ